MAHKKVIFSLILIIMAVIFSITFSGCNNTTEVGDVTVTDITIISQHEGNYILNTNGHIEDMDLSEITIKVVYTNGDEETLTVDDTMFSTEDLNKFEEKGEHTLFINYGGASIPITISIRDISEIEAYTATFFPLGGTTVKRQFIDVITRFADPSRENYTFDGWYKNIDCTGDRAISPYTLTEDTNFYAKWIDNRRCNVTFNDGDTALYQFQVVYGTSINPEDSVSYPDPSVKEGLIFTGWQVSQGQYYEITSDLILTAQYESVRCVANLEGYYSTYVDYGDYVTISGYELPEVAGYEARWVVYVNDSNDFIEWGDSSLNFVGQELQVNKSKIEIKVYQQINTYDIKIKNGLATQTDVNSKAGTLQLDPDYTIIEKEYNTTFNLEVIDGKNDAIATSYEGYNVEWCFFSYDKDNKAVWRNTSNLVWSDELNDFHVDIVNGDTQSRNFILKDNDGNKLATIKDGNITEIQGEIVIMPKYTKKNYTISLSRSNSIFKTFSVPYYTDFELYNPSVVEYANEYTTWDKVRDSYLLNTVASWLVANINESWQTAKWDIAWYNNPSSKSNEYKVNFLFNETSQTYGYYTIKENTVLYAQDIDNRTYNITIHYDYDFLNNKYLKEVKYENYTQSQELTLPSDLERSITYDKLVYTYKSLYDFPYEGISTKYYGNEVTNYNSRSKNMVYYAHYANKSKYDIYIHDKTQSEAYGAGSEYTVAEGSIYYSLLSGLPFDSSMLYKGTTTKVAQNYYDAFVYYTYFYNNTEEIKGITWQYNALLAQYGGAGLDKATAIDAIETLIEEKQTIINNYTGLLNALHSYVYGSMNVDYYNLYLTNGSGCYDMDTIYGSYDLNTYTYISNVYNAYREEIYDLQAKLELINDYADNSAIAAGYQSWTYNEYSDSVTTLNNVYPGTTDYYFAGWYYDSDYTLKADDIATNSEDSMYFAISSITSNIDLYAKWVDKKKGSEGLIFERVGANQVIVVNYLNYNQFITTDYDGDTYSQNKNDQGSMPKELGTSISLQIPSEHKFTLSGGTIEVCAVIGIIAGAFDTNSSIITDISITNNIQFVEEGVFKNCNLTTISYQTGATDYLYVDGDRALYQNLDFTALNGTILTDEKVLGSYGRGNLLAYANNSTVSNTYTIPGTINGNPVTKISQNAFKGTSMLETVIISENISIIEDYAFMGCNKLSLVTLPNSITYIGLSAFKDCSKLATITLADSTNLRYIKKDAFQNTAWLISRNGLVILGTKLIGVQVSGDGLGYEKDLEGNYLLTSDNENYIIGKDGESNTIYTIYIDANIGEVTRIVINMAITVISEYAFNGMTSLVSLDIKSNELIAIDEYAFNNCSSLNVVYFRNADNTITAGSNILAGCSRNLAFIFPQNYLTSYTTGISNCSIDMMEIDEVTDVGTLIYYKKASGYIITLHSFITAIGANVFSSGFETIAQVNIPNSVITIGAGAFANMSNLTAIIIPESVTSIGLGAFSGCTSLIKLTVPFIGDGGITNTYLGYIFGASSYTDNATYVPASLVNLVLENNTNYTSIADYALSNLDITSITLTNSISSIGNYAFYGNTKLVTIEFNQSILSVGISAFEGCIALSTISFSAYSNLKTIGDYAFKNCTSLTELHLNYKVESIGLGALEGCSVLSSITLNFIGQKLDGTGATYFGYIFGALSNNDITKIPSTLRYITVQANYNLTTITIADYAFYNYIFTGGRIMNLNISAATKTVEIHAYEGSTSLSVIA